MNTESEKEKATLLRPASAKNLAGVCNSVVVNKGAGVKNLENIPAEPNDFLQNPNQKDYPMNIEASLLPPRLRTFGDTGRQVHA
jgi:hypothetical protein